MDSLYFCLMILAIAWVCWWAIADDTKKAKSWSPFDMRKPGPQADPVPPTAHAFSRRPIRSR